MWPKIDCSDAKVPARDIRLNTHDEGSSFEVATRRPGASNA
jgi:hypothetical protein